MSTLHHRSSAAWKAPLALLLCSMLLFSVSAHGQTFGAGHFEFGDSWDSGDLSDAAHVRHITLRGASEEVMLAAVRASEELISVTFVECAPSGSVLEALAAHSQSLVTLAIYGEALILDADAVGWMNKLESLKTIAIPHGIITADDEEVDFLVEERRVLWNLSPERLEDASGTLLPHLPVWNLRHYVGAVDMFSLKYLVDARRLTVIEDTYYTPTNEVLQLLSKIPLLRELRLRNARSYPHSAVDGLASLSNLSALEVLEIHRLPAEFDVLAAALSELNLLRELTLVEMGPRSTGHEMTLEGLRALSTIKSLSTVSIQHCAISAEGVAALVKNSSIKRLEVLTSSHAPHLVRLPYFLLADLGGFARLESLNIEVMPGEEDTAVAWGERVIHAFSTNTHLRDVSNLPAIEVGPDGLSPLRKVQSIEVLNLESIEETVASGLPFLQELPNLHTLSLCALHITEDLGRVLAKCSRLSTLTVRWSSNGNLSHLIRTLDALDQRQLSALEFHAFHDHLPDAEVRRLLQSIARQERLERLVLYHEVTCEQLLLLKGATSLSHLETLTTFDDAPTALARNLTSLPALSSIVILNWTMTIEDAATLAEVSSLVHVTADVSAIVGNELLQLSGKHPGVMFQQWQE
jgi:hypothetical protein